MSRPAWHDQFEQLLSRFGAQRGLARKADAHGLADLLLRQDLPVLPAQVKNGPILQRDDERLLDRQRRTGHRRLLQRQRLDRGQAARQ